MFLHMVIWVTSALMAENTIIPLLPFSAHCCHTSGLRTCAHQTYIPVYIKHSYMYTSGIHMCVYTSDLQPAYIKHSYMYTSGLHTCIHTSGLHMCVYASGLHTCMQKSGLHMCIHQAFIGAHAYVYASVNVYAYVYTVVFSHHLSNSLVCPPVPAPTPYVFPHFHSSLGT